MTEGVSLGEGGGGGDKEAALVIQWQKMGLFQQWMRILAAHCLHYLPGLDRRLLLFWF